MARAQAVISPTVSPRSRMAVTAAAICAGVGSPRKQAAKKASASASVSVAPSARRESSGLKASVMALGRSGRGLALDACEVQEVGQQRMPAFGGDRLWVKLHAEYGAIAMPNGHDLSVVSPGCDVEHARERFAGDRKAVVARGGEGVGHALEQSPAGVVDAAGLAVHQRLGADHFAAECLADRLAAEADAKDRKVFGRGPNQFEADACLVRRAGAGGKKDSFGAARDRVCGADGVVAHDAGLRPKLVHVVDEVIGETIVVIDDQDHAARL